MADRHRGLGLRHCLLAVRALARFHGASAASLERNPSIADKFGNPFRENNAGFEIFTLSVVQTAADACRSWQGFEKYAEYLDSFKKIVMEKYMDLHDPKPESFNVILHGDFWFNNMLFRYEDGEPHDVRLLDLQISHVAPAVLDLLYFLSCSPSENVSEHYEDLLIREYHKALVDTMEFLGLEPPSLDAILADIKYHGSYSLFGTVGVLPLVRATTVPDLNAMMGGDKDVTNYLLENPAVKRWLGRVLPEYVRKGWLPT